MRPDLVSIVIPCFNDAKYLDGTLQSLTRQTYAPLEVVVVDDGSTDTTRSVALGRTDIDVKYVWQPNSGPAAARNRGMREVTGHYLQFLDADDIVADEKIATQVEALQMSDAAVTYCDYAVFEHDIALAARRGPPHSELKGIDFSTAFGQWTIVHRFLYETDLLRTVGGFDEDLQYAEDLDLWLRLIDGGVSFIYQDLPMAFYRFRDGRSARGKCGELAARLQIARRLSTCESSQFRRNHRVQIEATCAELERELQGCGRL